MDEVFQGLLEGAGLALLVVFVVAGAYAWWLNHHR